MYTPFATTSYQIPAQAKILKDLQQKQMFASITTPQSNNTGDILAFERDSNQLLKNKNVNADIY